jgi:hypothetical protein
LVSSSDKKKGFFEMENNIAPWEVHDTIVICNTLYGPEQSANGWFTSMAAFGQRTDHTLFKGRNQANVGLAYNNMQSQDRMDFAFHAFSFGLRFFGPTSIPENDSIEGATLAQDHLGHFFQYDLPNHVAVSFQVEQDEKILLNSYLAPSGYGPVGSGASYGADTPVGAENQMTFVGSQGSPDRRNRWQFDTPIGIPRNGTIEATLYISEWARNILSNIYGPSYSTQTVDTGTPGSPVSTITRFPTRYGIQGTLYGLREVQLRGQYHR